MAVRIFSDSTCDLGKELTERYSVTIVPLCIVIVGHPAEQPTPKDKWKPENVSYNKFGTSK